MKISSVLLIVFFLFSCGNNHSKESFSTASDTASVTGLTGNSVKLIKTANIDFKVKDIYQSAASITQTVHSMGGVITHRKIESIPTGTKELEISDDSVQAVSFYTLKAEMYIRVPSEKLDNFMDSIAAKAFLINSLTLDIEDKSLEYLSSSLKQQDRHKALNPTSGKEAFTNNPAELIEQKNTGTDQYIENRKIDAAVKFSTVQLNFTQNPILQKELKVNNNLSDYRLPFTRNMRIAFFDGWKYFINFIIAVTHLWMFILIGAAFFIIRYYNRKKKAELLKELTNSTE